MRKIFFLICTLCSMYCSPQVCTNMGSDSLYPYLHNIVSGYYYDHYDYPTSIEELMSYMEFNIGFYSEPYKQIIESLIIPVLDENKSAISIVKDEDFGIYLGTDTLLYLSPLSMFLSPCDIPIFIGKDPREYANFIRKFTHPLFFSQQGSAILQPEKLIKNFELQFHGLQRSYFKLKSDTGYNFYMHDNKKIPIHIFLEYKVNKGLYNYCTKEKIERKIDFYKTLDKLLDVFCRKHDCGRIVFVSPDYM